jgi:hypothetical protein
MKKYLAALAALIALTGAPAFAQTAPAVDPEAAVVVKQMLVAIKYRELMAASFQQVEHSFPDQVRSAAAGMIASDPKLSEAEKKEAMARVEQMVPGVIASIHKTLTDPALIDEMMAEMVPLYANNFTIDELRQLAAFYQSPLGQKMLMRTPKIMGESMAISNKLLAPRMQNMMAQMVQSVVKQ